MFIRNIAKYMCIFMLILPSFSFAAMQGLKGYYFNSANIINFSDNTCKNIQNEDPNYYKSLTRYTQEGEPFKDSKGCYYVDNILDYGWGGWHGIENASLSTKPDERQPRWPGTTDKPLGRPYQIEKSGISQPSDYWGVEWNGYLYLDGTANYKIWAQGNDGYSIWIDDQLMGDFHAVQGYWRKITLKNDQLSFNAGFHKVRIKFYDVAGDAFFRLGYTDDVHEQSAVKLFTAKNLYTSLPKQVSFTEGSYSAVEGESIKIRVRLDKLPEKGEEIAIRYKTKPRPGIGNFATENKDYQQKEGLLIFTQATGKELEFEIPTISDSEQEETEVFDIVLSNGPNNVDTIETIFAVGQIYDSVAKSTIEFAQAQMYTEEGPNKKTPNLLKVPIRLAKPASKDVSVYLKFRNATAKIYEDFMPRGNIVTIKKGKTIGYAEVLILNEGHIEPKFEHFFIDLDNPQGTELGSITTTKIVIKDKTDFNSLNVCFEQSDEQKTTATEDGWQLISSNEDSRITYTTKRHNFIWPWDGHSSLFPTFHQSVGTGMSVTKEPYYSQNNALSEKRLRLAEGRINKATGITHKSVFPAKGNFISLEFNLHAYGGCVLHNIRDGKENIWWDDCQKDSSGSSVKCGDLLRPYSKYGGDGMALVLYDANTTDVNIGGTGASLGYAQKIETSRVYNGFAGGWLGVGLDMFGNYINPSEGRERGSKPGSEGPIAFGNDGALQTTYRSNVTIRGSGSGTFGYKYLASYFPLNNQSDPESIKKPLGRWALDSYSADQKGYSWSVARNAGTGYTSSRTATDYDAGRFRLSIDNVDPKHTWIKLERAVTCLKENGVCLKDANGIEIPDYKIIIENFDAQESSYGQAPIPRDLKLAFTSATGAYCNIMEMGKLSLKANSCGPATDFNEFRVIELDYAKQQQESKLPTKWKWTKPPEYTSDKLWYWKWNSPLRTKILGETNTYCVLAGDRTDENASRAKQDKKVNIALFSKTADGIDSDGKISPVIKQEQISYAGEPSNKERFNFRYINFAQKKITKIEDLSTDGNLTIFGETSTNQGETLCFDINTSHSAPISKPGKDVLKTAFNSASQNAYFFVYDLNKGGSGDFYSSDSFALRPDHYRLSFQAKGSNESILPNDQNETILKSGVDYIIDSKAMYKTTKPNINTPDINTTFGYFAKFESKYANYGSNDDYSMLRAILVDKNTSTDLVCAYENNVTLGKIKKGQDESTTDVKNQLFKQYMRNGKLEYESNDNVKEWNKPSKNEFVKQYDNTMKFDVVMKDKEWTIVDFNKTKNNLPTAPESLNKLMGYGYECIGHGPSLTDADKKSLYGQSGMNLKMPPTCDINQTMPQTVYYVPNHFNANLLSLNDAVIRGADRFTYVSDYNKTAPHMAADINLTINAMSAKNNITTNYQNKCYANDVDFNISFVGNNFNLSERTVAGFDDSNRTARYRIWYDGDSNKYPDVNTSHLISKSPTSKTTDGNASFRIPNAKFTGGGVNTSVNFNFKRLANVPYEPFKINQDDFNLTHITDINYTSRVTNSNIDGNNTVKGGYTENNSSIAGGFSSRPTTPDTSTSTFYYGRAYTPENYKGAIDTDIKGSTYFLAYCLTCDKVALNIMTNWPLRLGVAWYQNLFHDELFPDGNITNYESTNGYSQDTVRVRNSSAHQSSQDIENGEEPVVFRSDTPGIDLVKMHASPWLIFNENNSTTNTVNFPVEFFGTGGDWAGQGTTINVDTREKGKIVGTTSIDINNTSDRVQDRIEW